MLTNHLIEYYYKSYTLRQLNNKSSHIYYRLCSICGLVINKALNREYMYNIIYRALVIFGFFSSVSCISTKEPKLSVRRFIARRVL